MGRAVFWGVVAATLAVYLVMVLWSLPRVAAAAGGLPPFDLRPLGYSETEARAFLAALTAEGRDLYTRVQHRLDLAFPALLGLTLLMSFQRLVRPGALLVALALLAFAQMAADYAENALVARMLGRPVAEVPAEMIARASSATLAKSGLVALALAALLAALAMRLWRRRV
jgi:hypothetical protein